MAKCSNHTLTALVMKMVKSIFAMLRPSEGHMSELNPWTVVMQWRKNTRKNDEPRGKNCDLRNN